jgi:TonB family protein
VYNYAEQMPELPGGGSAQAIVEFIKAKLVYPADLPAAEQKDGTVFVQFVVDKRGNVDPNSIKLVKPLTAPYNTAVVRAVEQLPRFTPGRQRIPAETGPLQPVAVSFTVPVRFGQAGPPAK